MIFQTRWKRDSIFELIEYVTAMKTDLRDFITTLYTDKKKVSYILRG